MKLRLNGLLPKQSEKKNFKFEKPRKKEWRIRISAVSHRVNQKLRTHPSISRFYRQKYIAGKSEPINIFSTCYHAPIKLYQIQRVLAEKADYAIEVLKKIWQVYPIPDVFRIDNACNSEERRKGKE